MKSTGARHEARSGCGDQGRAGPLRRRPVAIESFRTRSEDPGCPEPSEYRAGLWTVDANGGTPVAVTTDAPTDWSPEWSPDGEWLYFSSDRGGTTNLWRIAIDQRTGSARVAPQAITSSLTGVGYARFAADQRRIAVMAFSRSFELSLAPFDPSGGKVVATPAVRSPSLGWCSPSASRVP